MKRIINVVLTIIGIVVLKGCVVAPLYLCVSPFVTTWRWGGTWSAFKHAVPFEFKCVWHTLRQDWADGCRAIWFDLNKHEEV